jgi:iron-sulfur cluster assembly accessory protein
MCVTLTPAAAKFMQRMIRFGNAGPDAGFRLSVTPGGCSGFESSFDVEQPKPGDTVISKDGVTLILPEASCSLLRGCTIDFTDSRAAGGFSFLNTSTPQTCGCGSGQGAAGMSAQVVPFIPRTCNKKD